MAGAKEILLTGNVQGVGMRWTVKRIADSLGLSGWVKNNPDGSVVMTIAGEDALLDSFAERLREDMGACIDAMRIRDAKTGTARSGFAIVR